MAAPPFALFEFSAQWCFNLHRARGLMGRATSCYEMPTYGDLFSPRELVAWLESNLVVLDAIRPKNVAEATRKLLARSESRRSCRELLNFDEAPRGVHRDAVNDIVSRLPPSVQADLAKHPRAACMQDPNGGSYDAYEAAQEYLHALPSSPLRARPRDCFARQVESTMGRGGARGHFSSRCTYTLHDNPSFGFLRSCLHWSNQCRGSLSSLLELGLWPVLFSCLAAVIILLLGVKATPARKDQPYLGSRF